MGRPRQTRPFGVILAIVIAALGLCATPVHAAIVADFNGDGVLDQVMVPQTPGSGIVISISGAPLPQVLKLADVPLYVVAADLDHDGDVDLSAVSRRHRLIIWLNHGRGLLKRFRARFHHIGLQAPHSEILPIRQAREVEPSGRTNPSVVLAVGHGRGKVLCSSGRRVSPGAQATPTRECTRFRIPRAPPCPAQT